MMDEPNAQEYDVHDILRSRELSVERALRDSYGVEITQLVLPAVNYDSYVARLMSLVSEFSLCAQDAAALMWFEILDIFDEDTGAHFCDEPDECEYDNHDD